ncbi:MAG: hypothetical protein ACOC5T_00185 [Elusimicrobiota bacterium]
MKDKNRKKGFDYYLEEEILEGYKKKSVEKKLQWLYAGNKLRINCPDEVKERQEKYRRGEI